MNRYLAIKVTGAIIFAIASATGYSLDIAQITNLNFKWWPLIFFCIFIVLVIWIFVELHGKINKLLESKPMINVEQFQEGNIYYLKVHNCGAEGIFKAQLKLTSDDFSVSPLSQYNGYWRYGNKADTKILKGQDDFLKIAELHSSGAPGPISEHLYIWFFDESVNYAHYVSTSTHFLGATVTNQNGSISPLTKHEYIFHVTISSSPELKDGTYQSQFIMNIDGWL